MSSPTEIPNAGAGTARGARARRAVLTLCLLLVACAWLHGARDTRLDGRLQLDEAEWLCMGVHTWQLLRTGESVDVGATPEELAEAAEAPWKLGIQYSTFGWMNPLLPKLVFGALAEERGQERASRKVFPRFTPGRADERERARARFAPLLGSARALTTLLAAGAAVLLFGIGARVGGTVPGVAAYALWLLSPAVREAAVHVRTDLFPQVFTLGAVLYALARTRALTGELGIGSAWRAGTVLGLLAGLSVGSKLNGALVSIALAFWIPAVWALARERGGFARGPLTALAAAGAVCLGLFACSNPAVWSAQPLDGVQELLQRWQSSTGFQQKNLVGQVEIARTLGERLTLAWNGTLGRDEPLRALTGLPGGVLLLLGGLASLVVGLRRSRAPETRGRAAILLVWIGVTVVGTTLWLPIDWPRFFLPYLPCMVLLEGLVVGELVRSVR